VILVCRSRLHLAAAPNITALGSLLRRATHLTPLVLAKVGTLVGWQSPSTAIKATGRGDYWRTNLDRHGSSAWLLHLRQASSRLPDGDTVRAEVATGARKGVMLAALRWLAALWCASPALSASATLTASTPRTANFFIARTAIVMPRASTPAERALRLEHSRGGSGECRRRSPLARKFAQSRGCKSLI
jgi:hypothetical protein